MRIYRHPPKFAGFERRIAFLRPRIIDLMGVKGSRFPYWRRDFCHAHEAAELLRKLGERLVTFLQALVARLFGSTLIGANAAPTHFVHHRQQVNVKPIGGASILTVEDRIQIFK